MYCLAYIISMRKQGKFTIDEFRAMYPHDDACLDKVFSLRYGRFKKCPKCRKPFRFHRVQCRRCYECQWCAYQLYPTKNTVFEKTTTPLHNWFYAIYLMTATRSGVSAKEIQRQLGVTYKCAWRIAHQIRQLMGRKNTPKLSGKIEIDDTYVGGKRHGKRGRGAEGKTPVLGMVERKGFIRSQVIPDVTKKTIIPIIQENVLVGALINTDEFKSYKALRKSGYLHRIINHGLQEFVKGDCHTQSIEGFWSWLKRGISGTHVWVSAKHLQKYVNEFAFRYNQRFSRKNMFISLLGCISRPVQ